MQTAIAASITAVRQPSVRVTVDWDKNGSFEDDISAYVLAVEVTDEAVSRDAGGSSVASSVASTARVEVANNSLRFSPNQVGNVVGTAGGYMAPIQIELGFGASYLPQLTGYITKPQEHPGSRTVSFDCTDRWIALSRRRLSTPIRRDTYVHDLISDWMDESGLGFTQTLELSERIIDWAWMDDDPISEELLRIVEADGGVIWFDKVGALRYASATWPARNTTPVFVFTTARFTDLTPEWDYDQVFEEVIVRVQPRAVTLSGVLWSTDEDITVEANTTRDIVAHLREPAYALAKPVYDTDPEKSDWVALTSANQILEASGTSKVTVTLLNVGGGDVFASSPPGEFPAQAVTVRLVNTDTTHRAYVRKLEIRGTPIVSVKEIEERADTGGTVAQSLSIDNIYIQNSAHGQAIAQSRLARHQTPRYALSLKDVPAQPHLEVYDRVTVQETSESGINADFYVVRVVHKFPGDGSYKQDIDLVKAGDFTPRSDYYVIGTTALGAGRLWF